jgi:restriction endonuclease Mrr
MGIFNKDKIDRNNKSLWYCLETDFKNLDGHEFEQIVGKLYRKKGYRVIQTPKGADQGVDLIAKKGRITIIIQTKNWKNKVTNTDVLKTSGARQMFRANYSMIITSSTFTPSAKEAIQRSPRIRGTDIEGLRRQFRRYFVIKKPKEKSMIEKIKGKFTSKKSKKIVKKKIIRPIRKTRNLKSKKKNYG